MYKQHCKQYRLSAVRRIRLRNAANKSPSINLKRNHRGFMTIAFRLPLGSRCALEKRPLCEKLGLLSKIGEQLLHMVVELFINHCVREIVI